jgi:hypothetical protein
MDIIIVIWLCGWYDNVCGVCVFVFMMYFSNKDGKYLIKYGNNISQTDLLFCKLNGKCNRYLYL